VGRLGGIPPPPPLITPLLAPRPRRVSGSTSAAQGPWRGRRAGGNRLGSGRRSYTPRHERHSLPSGVAYSKRTPPRGSPPRPPPPPQPAPGPLRGCGVVTCGAACTASGASGCGCWLVKVPTEGTAAGDAPGAGLALPGEEQRRAAGETLPVEPRQLVSPKGGGEGGGHPNGDEQPSHGCPGEAAAPRSQGETQHPWEQDPGSLRR